MKKLVLVSLKTIAFFVGWAICASILPIVHFNHLKGSGGRNAYLA
ncbi:hypothetical protein [Blautia massiliensis (ex Durand et al. 2017)]|nr:hypothetical protein [Blautia massiliensis (ex Durand et al. 2017)]